MKVTPDGQVTIPLEIRNKLGLTPNSEVEFIVCENGQVVLRKKSTRGQQLIEKLRGKGSASMTTEQIMSLTRGEMK